MEVWEHWGHKFKPQLNQVIEPRNPCGPERHPETAAEPGPHAEASALAAHGGACRWALPSGGLGCPRAPELRVCAAHAPKAGVHPRGPFLEAPPAPGAAGPGTPSCSFCLGSPDRRGRPQARRNAAGGFQRPSRRPEARGDSPVGWAAFRRPAGPAFHSSLPSSEAPRPDARATAAAPRPLTWLRPFPLGAASAAWGAGERQRPAWAH